MVPTLKLIMVPPGGRPPTEPPPNPPHPLYPTLLSPLSPQKLTLHSVSGAELTHTIPFCRFCGFETYNGELTLISSHHYFHPLFFNSKHSQLALREKKTAFKHSYTREAFKPQYTRRAPAMFRIRLRLCSVYILAMFCLCSLKGSFYVSYMVASTFSLHSV